MEVRAGKALLTATTGSSAEAKGRSAATVVMKRAAADVQNSVDVKKQGSDAADI